MTPVAKTRPVWAGLLLAVGAALFILLANPARAGDLSKQELDYLRQKGPIVFVSQSHYPPFEFLGDDGDHTGMSIELARWIATRFGFKTRFIDTSFKQAQEAVLTGKADVITSLFYSKKRDQVFDFTQPMFQVPASIFVAADRPDIKGLQDLNGKVIAMQAGDYAQEFLESKHIKCKVAWTRDFAQAINLVIAGKADAVIGDEQIVLYHLYANSLVQFIKKVGPPLYVGQVCMGVSHGHRVLLGILNKGIALAKRTGTLERINTIWLGVRYKVGEPFIMRYLPQLAAAVGIILLLALLAWLWNLRLRSLVARRTEALARSEKTLQAILAKSPLGIGLVKNRVLDWHNETMRTMLGYQPGELEGKVPLMVFPSPEEYHRTDAAINQSLRQRGDARVETKLVRKDGSVFDCLLHCALLERGGQANMIVIAQDISERKRAEEELAQSERQYRLLAENVTDVIWTADKDFNFIYVSPSVEKLRGFTPEEIMAQSIEDVLTPQSMERVRELVQEVLAKVKKGDTNIPAITTELEQPCKDGSTVWTEAVVNAVFDEDGNFSHFQGVTRDITQRKKLEAQLREAQKMQSLGTLSGGIAHEFNNILAVIMGHAELALADTAEMKSPAPQLKRIIQAVKRARNLVRQILTFSRQVATEKVPLELNREVRQAVELLKRTLPRTIRIKTRLAPELRMISGDANQIEQILINLASNARDAMPQGGELVFETANVELDQERARLRPGLRPGPYVLLRVSDTGQGMDPEVRAQAFDPFFTTKEVGEGTGLGLSTVHGIVQFHGGHIACRSRPGQGTTIEIHLPALPAGQAAAPGRPKGEWTPPAGRTGRGERILLVDDEPELRALGVKFLESLGYQVLTAQNGEEALEILDRGGTPPDLVILDLGMPGMGGERCLKQIMARHPRTKVIVASGYLADEKVKESLRSGAASFVAKPFQRAELAATVRQVLDEDRP